MTLIDAMEVLMLCLEHLVRECTSKSATTESRACCASPLIGLFKDYRNLWPVVWMTCYATGKHAARVKPGFEEVADYAVRFARAYESFK